MGSQAIIPLPPPGFKMDDPASVPPPPPGFTLDSEQQSPGKPQGFFANHPIAKEIFRDSAMPGAFEIGPVEAAGESLFPVANTFAKVGGRVAAGLPRNIGTALSDINLLHPFSPKPLISLAKGVAQDIKGPSELPPVWNPKTKMWEGNLALKSETPAEPTKSIGETSGMAKQRTGSYEKGYRNPPAPASIPQAQGAVVPPATTPTAIAPENPPAPPKPPTVDELLKSVRDKMVEKGWLPKAGNLGELPKGTYKDRFDVGSNAPVMQEPQTKTVKPSENLKANPRALEAARNLAAAMKEKR